MREIEWDIFYRPVRACTSDFMEGSLNGSAIVYFSSIGQHGCCTHHGAPMTDTSSRLAMGSCWIAVHLDGLIHSSVPPFFQLPLHASIHFLMQSRFSFCFAPCAISLGGLEILAADAPPQGC